MTEPVFLWQEEVAGCRCRSCRRGGLPAGGLKRYRSACEHEHVIDHWMCVGRVATVSDSARRFGGTGLFCGECFVFGQIRTMDVIQLDG